MRLACRPCSTPIGRGATCALAAWPLAASPSTRPSRRRQPSGRRWRCASDTENGRPARGEQAVEHLELALGIGRVEVGDELDDAAAGILHAERDAQQLVLGGAQRRRRIALHRAMVERARGREADARRRASPRAVSTRICATSSGVASSSRAARSPITKTRSAPCGSCAPRSMSRGLRLERIEILAERFPRPVEAFVERGAGNVLDAFHQLDQALAVLDLHRREADAAIAHHRRGDAVPARGLQVRVPGRLAVIVGVDVDEAGRDQQALGRRSPPRPARSPRRRRRSCRPSPRRRLP